MSSTDSMHAASDPFMSYDPRPYKRPLSTRGRNGSGIPATPTVSIWAFSTSDRPPPLPFTRAITLSRPGAASSISAGIPRSAHQPITKRAIPPSPAPPGTRLGFTESIETSASSNDVTLSWAKELSYCGTTRTRCFGATRVSKWCTDVAQVPDLRTKSLAVPAESEPEKPYAFCGSESSSTRLQNSDMCDVPQVNANDVPAETARPPKL
jgi:hypothetical protein